VRREAAEDQPRRAGGAGRLSHRTPGAHPGGRGPALRSGEFVVVVVVVVAGSPLQALRHWKIYWKKYSDVVVRRK